MSTLRRFALVAMVAAGTTFLATPPTSADKTTTVGPMSQKLSNKLSPQAKKAVMLGSDRPVVALVQMAPTADRDATEHALRALAVDLRSWSGTTSVATVEVPADKLEQLADLEGVIYIEIGERYQP